MSNDFQSVHELGFLELNRRLSRFIGDATNEADPRGTGQVLHLLQDGVHFDLTYHPLRYLARKVVTSALSDALAEFGEQPVMNLTLGLPNGVSVGMVELFMEGAQEAAEMHGIRIHSTQCTASRQHMSIACALTWRPGDWVPTGRISTDATTDGSSSTSQDLLIGVTGDLGAAFAGLRILLREKRMWLQHSGQEGASGPPPDVFQPELDEYRHVVQRQLAPEARVDFVAALRELSLRPVFLAPVRDGIHQDLQVVFERYGLGGEIHATALPIDPHTREVADELMEDVDRYALFGGEDYEMLFALPRANFEALASRFSDVVPIGRLLPGTTGLTIHAPDSASQGLSLN